MGQIQLAAISAPKTTANTIDAAPGHRVRQLLQ